MSEEEKIAEASPKEDDFPCLDLVYDLSVADYHVVERRCTAGTDRAGVILTVEIALSGAAMCAIGPHGVRLPWWALLPPAALCLIAYVTAAWAALRRGLRMLHPESLARDFRHMSPTLFKNYIVEFAAKDAKSNRDHVRSIWRLLVVSISSFLLAVGWSAVTAVVLLQ